VKALHPAKIILYCTKGTTFLEVCLILLGSAQHKEVFFPYLWYLSNNNVFLEIIQLHWLMLN